MTDYLTDQAVARGAPTGAQRTADQAGSAGPILNHDRLPEDGL